MRLDQYPRPRGDTGIGFHYVLDTDHYDRESLRYWVGELKDLGASWLVLPSTLGTLVPEYFVRELIAAHIEPVIRIDVWPIQSIDRVDLMAACRRYAEWGAYYVTVYSSPNLASQWRIDAWRAPGLVPRFVELLVAAYETIELTGLFPLFCPLEPGGHYWDLTFFDEVIGLLAKDEYRSIRDRLGVCIYQDVGNRPLTWGKGGPRQWPNVRPYDRSTGSQDHRGFYLFEWYDAIVRQHLGQSLPMISAETRLVPGVQSDPAFPATDEMTHSVRAVELARLMMDGEAPDYLFNTAFWALGAARHDSNEVHAWYRRDTRTLPAVSALKQLKKRPRRFSWDGSADAAQNGDGGRPIYHYVLVQPGDAMGGGRSSARWMLPVVVDYAGHFRSTVGFSADEARRASRVTVIGHAPRDAADAEESLRDAGCLVERIDATSENELRRALDDLIRRGRRFRQLPG